MTHQDIVNLIDSIGLPAAYFQFPENPDDPVAPPFICFYYPDDTDFYADGINFVNIRHLVIELYTRYKDLDLEDRIKEALSEAGLTWSRYEMAIDDEKLYETVFELDVIIN